MGGKDFAVGGARGIFEILVPGIFLLSNMLAAFYFSPWAGQGTEIIVRGLGNPATGLVFLICFGYLMGVLLRVVRADTPDRWSRWVGRLSGPKTWLRNWLTKEAHSAASKFNGPSGSRQFDVGKDTFPYIAWLGKCCYDYMPQRLIDYWKREWEPREKKTADESEMRNKPFFNLCKMAVVSSNSPLAAEVYAAEALTRYVACMFYALRIALLLALFMAAANFIAVLPRFTVTRTLVAWLVVAAVYGISLFVILKNFRTVRFKEVDTVFTACYLAGIRFEVDESTAQSLSGPETEPARRTAVNAA